MMQWQDTWMGSPGHIQVTTAQRLVMKEKVNVELVCRINWKFTNKEPITNKKNVLLGHGRMQTMN